MNQLRRLPEARGAAGKKNQKVALARDNRDFVGPFGVIRLNTLPLHHFVHKDTNRASNPSDQSSGKVAARGDGQAGNFSGGLK